MKTWVTFRIGVDALERALAEGIDAGFLHEFAHQRGAQRFSPFEGASGQGPLARVGTPDQEPSADRIAELTDLAERDGVTTIFTETLVSPRVAETLAREAGGLKTETLNPLEGLDDAEIDAGADYLSVMRDNLQLLRDALGCS